ncbi:cbb3-type cytochrome c oxidase N-terminal domain-containing protein [Geopsychrobacter electrodiphilus]|uniref:cbb3-type cytochrome c oxidase N-terminal domain-containing protein n=1 Tax=Geopsychrobacter electrodiphilus TaxID=225196 RepID=UPI000365EA88|nr:cbb3-type cytochrome c oxidase N-terminal domain-containing protein [Geopsychrobacter electrodiphilus]
MNSIDQHTDEHADGIVEDRKQAPPIYFNILFYGLIVWGVIFMAYFLLSGWSSHQEFAQKMKIHQNQSSSK